MNDVRFTKQKLCPYCRSTSIEYIDLTDILNNNGNRTSISRVNKHVFKCKSCKELFYYTGELITEASGQKVNR